MSVKYFSLLFIYYFSLFISLQPRAHNTHSSLPFTPHLDWCRREVVVSDGVQEQDAIQRCRLAKVHGCHVVDDVGMHAPEPNDDLQGLVVELANNVDEIQWHA